MVVKHRGIPIDGGYLTDGLSDATVDDLERWVNEWLVKDVATEQIRLAIERRRRDADGTTGRG